MNRKEAYRRFLQTPFWTQMRQQALDRDGNACTFCGDTERLQVHHKVYRKDWMDTQLADLKTLCNICHRIEHGLWVTLPIDDLYLELKSFIGQSEKPPVELWSAFKSECYGDYETELFGELMLFYCQAVLRKDREFMFAVRDSILSRCAEYKHLAKNSEWRKKIESQLPASPPVIPALPVQ